MVPDSEAREIMKSLMSLVSGYMVPKLTREEEWRRAKQNLA